MKCAKKCIMEIVSINTNNNNTTKIAQIPNKSPREAGFILLLSSENWKRVQAHSHKFGVFRKQSNAVGKSERASFEWPGHRCDACIKVSNLVISSIFAWSTCIIPFDLLKAARKTKQPKKKEEREKEREQKVIIDGLTHFFSHFWIVGRRILLARRLHKIDSILCIHKCIILWLLGYRGSGSYLYSSL